MLQLKGEKKNVHDYGSCMKNVQTFYCENLFYKIFQYCSKGNNEFHKLIFHSKIKLNYFKY